MWVKRIETPKITHHNVSKPRRKLRQWPAFGKMCSGSSKINHFKCVPNQR